MPTVTDIMIYPVKGCRPVSVQQAAITPTGELEYILNFKPRFDIQSNLL